MDEFIKASLKEGVFLFSKNFFKKIETGRPKRLKDYPPATVET